MKFWNLTEIVDASKTIEEVTSPESIELDVDSFHFAIIGSRVFVFNMLGGDPERHKLVRWSFWP